MAEPVEAAEPQDLREVGALIAERYRILSKLGGGGMAVVFEVLDSASGRALALKRLEVEPRSRHRKRAEELFALEFQTLSQLAHPRIVEVYDYGIDRGVPYYTMELLDGGDLQQLIPAPYQRVCAIALDVCSALSLLHSRRIVHRDVNPRNIRCSVTGAAKLIDFGAMSLMGPAKELVGTPAYCAPEVLNMQPLGAATDLYALGATLYFALTGRHAHPARDFAALADAWSFEFPRPSELVSEIPDALDSLVLELLQPDERDRPNSASEVMDRLAAIVGRPVDEQLRVAQAYLVTPALVGRDAELTRVQEQLRRARQRRGGGFAISGASGVGRSRFLDACMLESKIAGVSALRADAAAIDRGEYGALRALFRQLQQQSPELLRRIELPELDVLVHALPELGAHTVIAPRAFADSAALRMELQQRLRRLWLQLAEHVPLFLAIDDLHELDEPSAAVIALLASDLRGTRIVIAATRETLAKPIAGAACQLFDASAEPLPLENLSDRETATLLGSMFGAHTQMSTLAARVFAIARGNPRDCMRLAQHLVDRGVARYRAGAWTLPAHLDAIELPASMLQVLHARVASLRESARLLACAFALCPDQSFGLLECASFALPGSGALVFGDIEQLIKCDMLRASGEHLMLMDRAWVELILADVPEHEVRDMHRRLAHTFEARGAEEFRTAQHWLRAGDEERALDLLIAHAERSLAVTDEDSGAFFKLVGSLPADALSTYDEALRLCAVRNRPERQSFVLRTRMAGIATVTDVRESFRVSTDMIEQLKVLSGLSDYDAADPTLEPLARLSAALAQTQARYDAATEHERVLDPIGAIRALARNCVEFIGASAPALNLSGLLSLPRLEPLAVLSPALVLVDSLIQGVQARMTGRFEHARAIYIALLERTTTPEQSGLTAAHHRYMRLVLSNGLALIEASLGLPSTLARVAEVEADPMFRVNAVLIRMLYCLWQGDSEAADHYGRQVHVLRVESVARIAFENTHLVWQVSAHAALGDLSRLKRTLIEIQVAAEDHPGWQPVLAFARAEQLRLLGNLRDAIAAFEQALAPLRAGEHQLWANLAGGLVRALDAVGRSEQAVACGERYLDEAQRAQLGEAAEAITLPLRVAQARIGRSDVVAQLDAEIAAIVARGTTGLRLALAYDARVQIAALAEDDDAFAAASAARDGALAGSKHAIFAGSRQRRTRFSLRSSASTRDPHVDAMSLLQSQLATCRDATERAGVGLQLLAESAHAGKGHLFLVRGEELRWRASIGTGRPSEGLCHLAESYVRAQLQSDESTTGAEAAPAQATAQFSDPTYRSVLLSHYVGGTFKITGLALFEIESNGVSVHPGALATQLSRFTNEQGDASALTSIAPPSSVVPRKR